MKLVIRADDGPQLGSGHLMRCIALGQAWVDHGIGSVEVVCCELPSTCYEQLRAEGWPVHLVGPVGTDADIEGTSTYARGAALALDGYKFDYRYQCRVRMAANTLLVIDDCGDRDGYACDVLLNQNPHATTELYPGVSEARMLLGTEYAMLRREFRLYSRPQRQHWTSPTRVLVTLGGSDTRSALPLVLNALLHLDLPGLHVTVIVGSTKLIPEIQELSNHLGATLLCSVQNMVDVMRTTDVAITAAGSTLYETLFMGIPTACLIIAENQVPGSSALANRGLVHLLGKLDDLDAVTLRKSLATWLSKARQLHGVSEEGPRCVDGKGALRVAASVSNTCRSSRV